MSDEITYMKVEEKRQAQLFSEAMQAAIDATSKTIDMPMFNALAGAIVTIEAGMLSAVKDLRHRKMLKEAMKRARPKAMAEADAKEPTSRVVTVNLNKSQS